MGRIHVLPDRVANQIAAGEVVERPASVVKELLENSLDAGAKHVRVEVASGGRRLIRIVDDGCGMGRDDAMLAFERHATSKLREVGDLLSIGTLGFRGEALPSIASVSRLLLETSAAEEPEGTKIEIAGGRMLRVEDAALPEGTTISVRDLFYNVPARRKFLRTEKTELSHVASLVTHYSLAHLDKSFQLSSERSTLLNVTPVETLRERVYQVFGSDALNELVELEPVERALEVAGSPQPPTRAVAAALDGPGVERRVFRARGFVSAPHVQKLNRNALYVFVNGRLIRDRIVLKAISNAYHNILPPGTHPFALLFLEIPLDEVDVNVHPSKTEVRFRHQSFVHDFVRDTVRQQLMESKPVSTIPLPASPAQPGTGIPYSDALPSEGQPLPSETDEPRRVDVGEAGDFGLRREPPPTQRFDFSSSAPIELGSQTDFEAAAEPAFTAAAAALADLPIDAKPHSQERLAAGSRESLADVGQLRALGQIRESFIVAASDDGLWIIDQHVAHERILFEKVLKQREDGLVEGQRMLMPIVLTLRPDQQVIFSEIEEELRASGFEVEPFGHNTVAVKTAPAGLSPQDVETLLHEILDTPEKELRGLSLDDLRKQVAATVACHAAIKVNMPLDGQKMRWLLDELGNTECPMSCPHGRPIALKYPLKDILKAFHRI